MTKVSPTFNYAAFNQLVRTDPLGFGHVAIALGITTTTLLSLVSGRHQPQVKTLMAIYARYPQLALENVPVPLTLSTNTPSETLDPIAQLKADVWEANRRLVEAGLVVLSWGNASGVDRQRGIIAIKPSGVDYAQMKPEDIVLVRLDTGTPLPNEKLNPSSDTPTHLYLYQHFPTIGGIVHTHSSAATSWAQACRSIPCYGTTHADVFHGPVPLSRELTPEEIRDRYEWNTGTAIVDSFQYESINPLHVPGVLVPHHGPFTWGATPQAAVEHAITLEEVAKLAAQTEALKPTADQIPAELLEKHFSRKHGAGAYYGQRK